jgi:hypothetical protein
MNAMHAEPNASGLWPLIGLPKRQIFALAGVRGARLRSHRGALWVTQDHDRRDVVLAEGESLVIERDGRVLVQALDAALLSVTTPPRTERPAASPRPWWARWRMTPA